ncbi:uncharacterized protein LOC103958368 [Pyrus x bretschneideri]|uniref:uncharacterized protein LOC103958368 n=1 Tax=Pyrus x bretschneideri TaxID=225117 RepID=UPI0020309238|nr:uncharacterized protein LOC103958368 [Pyrus x bretschneideri]
MSTSASKKDFAWQWTKDVDPVSRYFYCVYCNQKCTGSITRFKHHLGGISSGGMAICKKVPPNVKEQCIANIKGIKQRKKVSNELCRGVEEESESMDMGVNTTAYYGNSSRGSGSGNESVPASQHSSTLPPRSKGDRYVSLEAHRATLNTPFKKEERKQVCRKLAQWFYASAIPFNAANSDYYFQAMKAVSDFGPGFEAPTSHEYRTWMLKEEVDDVQRKMQDHVKAWKRYGCTIMLDGWSDGKSMCLINFLINSPQGTWFLKSVDASASIKNEDLLYGYLDDVIQEIGEENVVQVISDNASNYKNARAKLMERKEKLWWTQCAAHCIDLMLKDIAKMKWFDDTLKHAKCVTKYLYGHQWVLALMRKFTNNTEILRPAVTRFATSFLTLQILQKQKENLVALFSSQEWSESTYAKSREAKLAKYYVIHDHEFWGRVSFCIRGVLPLVCVLREVDSEERHAMGFMYELIDVVKEKIANNLNKVEKKYMPIWKKIDHRWNDQLHQPLYAAGYYLNPQFRYEDNFSNTEEIRNGLFACMDRMLGNSKEREDADIQLDLYDRRFGDFADPMAMKTRKRRTPLGWWQRFGNRTPELMRFAIRVLGLTCSASGCERNWSTFQMIHKKKRNGLEHKRLNALAYVKYNLALSERSLKRSGRCDPILVEEIDSDDEWITEREDPVLPQDPRWLEDESLFNAEAVRNVPLPIYEDSPQVRDPREPSPPPRQPSPPPCEPTPLRELTPPHEPTQPRVLITYKRKRINEETSSQRNTILKHKSEDSFEDYLTHLSSSTRLGNEEDDITFDLDEEDLSE